MAIVFGSYQTSTCTKITDSISFCDQSQKSIFHNSSYKMLRFRRHMMFQTLIALIGLLRRVVTNNAILFIK